MRLAHSRTPLIAPLLRGIDGWYDAARGGRAVWILLALFVAAWTLFQVISYAVFCLKKNIHAYISRRSGCRPTDSNEMTWIKVRAAAATYGFSSRCSSPRLASC